MTSPPLVCDVSRTRDTGIVTSYSSIVLTCSNWRKSDLHLWITTVNTEFTLLDIHGSACWCFTPHIHAGCFSYIGPKWWDYIWEKHEWFKLNRFPLSPGRFIVHLISFDTYSGTISCHTLSCPQISSCSSVGWWHKGHLVTPRAQSPHVTCEHGRITLSTSDTWHTWHWPITNNLELGKLLSTSFAGKSKAQRNEYRYMKHSQ